MAWREMPSDEQSQLAVSTSSLVASIIFFRRPPCVKKKGTVRGGKSRGNVVGVGEGGGGEGGRGEGTERVQGGGV